MNRTQASSLPPGPFLIVLAGLPGTGKSTLAAHLARRIGAVHLRIDRVEQTLRDRARWQGDMDESGYRIAEAIAADNLANGQRVIADAVNPVQAARRGWRDLAARHDCALTEIEIHCSDRDEHRRRVETRTVAIANLVPPDWEAVLGHAFEPWPEPHHRLDTAGRTVDECLEALLRLLSVPPEEREN